MEPARTILIIEDDPAVRSALRELLSTLAGCEIVDVASQAPEAQEVVPDLLIATAPGPDHAAFHLCRGITGPSGRASAILLVPAGDPALPATARAAGASAVLTTPLRPGLLLETTRRLLRALPDRQDRLVPVGRFRFDPERRCLHAASGAGHVRLTEKEAAILLHLHTAATAVDRQRLLQEVWGYNDQVSTHTLETHIYRLRQKIEANPAEARVLVTEDGGYRLRQD